MSCPVVIVEYDPEWPVRYEEEKRLILGAVGRRILGIEHVGSTAVPGLGAKPTIDILAGVSDQEAVEQCLPALGRVGYTDVTPCPEDPDWYYCVGKGERPHNVHLHLAKYKSAFWERHLLFRDFLRAHPEKAQEYYRLKKRLAEKCGSERQAYCDGKTLFIRSVEVRARGICIRQMEAGDIDRIIRAFARWHKKRSQYERYFDGQRQGERVVLVALDREEVVGYVVIVWNSRYEPFQQDRIPEVVDLNVINEFQRQGIGTALVHQAERIALEHSKPVVGISVKQSPEYAAANRLYPSLGYVPDGRGITRYDNELHLTKTLGE